MPLTIVFFALNIGIDSNLEIKPYYRRQDFPAEKSVDAPSRGLLTFAGNPVICAVECRSPFQE